MSGDRAWGEVLRYRQSALQNRGADADAGAGDEARVASTRVRRQLRVFRRVSARETSEDEEKGKGKGKGNGNEDGGWSIEDSENEAEPGHEEVNRYGYVDEPSGHETGGVGGSWIRIESPFNRGNRQTWTRTDSQLLSLRTSS